MNHEEFLVGFDARDMSPEKNWDDEARRTLFLINPAIHRPLSVDTMIWPSIFVDIEEDQLKLGWYRPFWSSLDEMKTSIALLGLISKPFLTIAATIFLSDVEKDFTERTVAEQTLSPPSISLDWKLLGYDVAGGGFLSSLMSMGYHAEEQASRAPFAQDLNEYHLFTSFDAALDYEDWSEDADEVHGPYYVHGVYQID